MKNIFDKYTIVEINGIKPVIEYKGIIFSDINELHQYKINNIWCGIDIAVTLEDIIN